MLMLLLLVALDMEDMLGLDEDMAMSPCRATRRFARLAIVIRVVWRRDVGEGGGGGEKNKTMQPSFD
jgi:hypothetical protein